MRNKTLFTICHGYHYFNRQICDIMECHKKKVTLSDSKSMQLCATVAKAATSNHCELK